MDQGTVVPRSDEELDRWYHGELDRLRAEGQDSLEAIERLDFQYKQYLRRIRAHTN